MYSDEEEAKEELKELKDVDEEDEQSDQEEQVYGGNLVDSKKKNEEEGKQMES